MAVAVGDSGMGRLVVRSTSELELPGLGRMSVGMELRGTIAKRRRIIASALHGGGEDADPVARVLRI